MKKPTIFLALILVAGFLHPNRIFAQPLAKMSYQAVVRNTGGELVVNKPVGMRISILQGSVGGNAVFVETHCPTSNANGLISIEIGEYENLGGINWADGPYFLKTEIDPAGGSNYSISGTSQLLSVPYALYAKTVAGLDEKVDKIASKGLSTEDYTSADKIKLAGIADGAEPNVNADWNATSGDAQIMNKPNIPAASDGSETKLAAGTNVTISGNGTTASPYVVNAAGGSGSSHFIGELYGGGVVFWIDHTGQHGLIVSMVDLFSSWSNITNKAIGITNDWDGATNTTAIIGQIGHISSAAKLCAEYTNANFGTGTYSDWYLPSIFELNDLWNNIKSVTIALVNDDNATSEPLYRHYVWSSSEEDATYALCFSFNDGIPTIYSKFEALSVRAIRAF